VIQANLTQGSIYETLKPHSNTGTYVEVNDQKFIKHKEEAELDDDENEIDVENISDKEECCKNEQRSVCLSSIFIPTIGPVKFDSSSKSIANYQGYEKKINHEENEVCRTEAIQSIETSKLAHRQRFSVNLQKQNTQSVIINGKRYYRKYTYTLVIRARNYIYSYSCSTFFSFEVQMRRLRIALQWSEHLGHS